MLTAAVSIVTFVVGLLLGHWLAPGRDNRREFNEAAQPVRDWLLQKEARPSVYGRGPSAIELDTFASCLRTGARKRYDAALHAFRVEQRKAGTNGIGELILEDPEAFSEAVRRLLPFTERR
jgi:hypothetical protein